MSATIAEARDAILQLITDAWDSSAYPLLYDDRKASIPNGRDGWARVTLQHNSGDQAGLSNPIGNRLWTRDGLVVVQVFTQAGDGLKLSDQLAQVALNAYEGKQTPNGVWFRSCRIQEIGPSGNWFQVNVIAEFYYTEVK